MVKKILILFLILNITVNADIVDYAKQYLGTPYVWGGNSLTNGVDCSGFTQQVMKQFNVDIYRTASMQSTQGSLVSQDNLIPGDLIFFDTITNNDKDVDHVGMYIGNNEFIHASSTVNSVTINSLNNYNPRIVTTKRFLTKIFSERDSNVLNKEMFYWSDYFFSKATDIFYIDPIWPLALINLETPDTGNNNPYLYFDMVVDLDKYIKTPNYLETFTWKDVPESILLSGTYSSIGPFQFLESYADNTPLVVDHRYSSLGDVTGKLTHDRWNYLDSLNVMAGQINSECKRVAKKELVSSLINRYEKAVYMMWSHNTGQGILTNPERRDTVIEVVSHKDAIYNLLRENKPSKFKHQAYLMDYIKENNLKAYPTMALMSYLIIESRCNGEW